MKPRVLLVFFFVFGVSQPLWASTLAQADSLYALGQYQQAGQAYAHCYLHDSLGSDRMLARWAECARQSDEIAAELFARLNLFHSTRQQASYAALQQRTYELNLTGYWPYEYQYLYSLYRSRRQQGAALGAALCTVLLLAMGWRRWRRRPLRYYPIFFGTAWLGTLALGNLPLVYRQAIVMQPGTLLYANASIVGPALGTVPAGSLVLVQGSTAGWQKVLWNGKNGYVVAPAVQELRNL